MSEVRGRRVIGYKVLVHGSHSGGQDGPVIYRKDFPIRDEWYPLWSALNRADTHRVEMESLHPGCFVETACLWEGEDRTTTPIEQVRRELREAGVDAGPAVETVKQAVKAIRGNTCVPAPPE